MSIYKPPIRGPLGDGTIVVILDRLEAEALTDCLLEHPTLAEDYPALDELANEMAGRT